MNGAILVSQFLDTRSEKAWKELDQVQASATANKDEIAATTECQSKFQKVFYICSYPRFFASRSEAPNLII
jgi:hypothetical protein